MSQVTLVTDLLPDTQGWEIPDPEGVPLKRAPSTEESFKQAEAEVAHVVDSTKSFAMPVAKEREAGALDSGSKTVETPHPDGSSFPWGRASGKQSGLPTSSKSVSGTTGGGGGESGRGGGGEFANRRGGKSEVNGLTRRRRALTRWFQLVRSKVYGHRLSVVASVILQIPARRAKRLTAF